MKSHEGLLGCMFPHEVKRGVFLDIDEEDFGIIRGACSDCGACGPYVGIQTTKATDEEKREAVRLWNALARTPSPSGAREILARVRAIVDKMCDETREAEKEANRKSRESGNSDGAWFHHGAHMAAGCMSEALEELEVEIESALRSQQRGEGE